jgi:hypothetical protein
VAAWIRTTWIQKTSSNTNYTSFLRLHASLTFLIAVGKSATRDIESGAIVPETNFFRSIRSRHPKPAISTVSFDNPLCFKVESFPLMLMRSLDLFNGCRSGPCSHEYCQVRPFSSFLHIQVESEHQSFRFLCKDWFNFRVIGPCSQQRSEQQVARDWQPLTRTALPHFKVACAPSTKGGAGNLRSTLRLGTEHALRKVTVAFEFQQLGILPAFSTRHVPDTNKRRSLCASIQHLPQDQGVLDARANAAE